MPQSLSAVYIHLVFSTKERRPFLRDSVARNALHARFGRTITQADWVKELKRVSNLWLKEQDPVYGEFQWQGGYADFSVSPSNLERVRNYINNQEAHHRKLNFQDKFRALLRKHDVEWDERFVWD